MNDERLYRVDKSWLTKTQFDAELERTGGFITLEGISTRHELNEIGLGAVARELKSCMYMGLFPPDADFIILVSGRSYRYVEGKFVATEVNVQL